MMMNEIRCLTAVCVACAAAALAARDFDVRAFGATGDGETLDTRSLQRAIDVCSAYGGGRVVLEKGRYLTGTLTLKSGVDLHVDVSATLLGSTNCADYVESPDIRHVDPTRVARGRATCLVYADEATNIAVSGRGTIDCNGQAFVRPRPVLDAWTAARCRNERIPGLPTPPRVFFFAGCRNAQVTDITVVNQPSGWCFWVNDCDVVLFDRVRIFGGMQSPNNDGIHINCCRDVLVSNCIIETQDDAVVVRADYGMLKGPRDCERVAFVNCSLMSHCACIRLSFLNDGAIRSCSFSNILMHDSQMGLNLELCPKKGAPPTGTLGRESLVEDILFSNIDMQRVLTPLRCITGNRPEVNCRSIRDIRFSECHSRGGKRLVFSGGEGNPFERFVFTNCTFPTEEPVAFVNCRDFRFDSETFNRKE